MKFGIAFANIGPFIEPERRLCAGSSRRRAGFESIWTVDHVVVPAGYRSTYPYDPSGRLPSGEDAPFPDPLIWLAYVARATSTIRLATGILILPQRNPLVLAKELATLDYLSSGRVTLGVGIGWLKEEFEALGVPFERRGRADRGGHRGHAGPVVARSGPASTGATVQLPRRLLAATAPGGSDSRSTSGVTARSPPGGRAGSGTGSSRSVSTATSCPPCRHDAHGRRSRRAAIRPRSSSPSAATASMPTRRWPTWRRSERSGRPGSSSPLPCSRAIPTAH